MGHSRSDKAESHERIVRAAALKLREAGLKGVGVADLMQAAGLTHGGFYRHFESREALVAEAVHAALEQGERRMRRIADKHPEAPFAALVEHYLRPAHRAEVADGCALVALSADAARAGPEVRSAFAEQVARYIGLYAELLNASDPPAARAEAVLALSAMVGALALARAVDDEALAREILESTTAALKARSAP